MTGREITPLKAFPLPVGTAFNAVPTPEPVVQWVDPATLCVDRSYQRSLSQRSARLIQKIAVGFDWRRFKPPIVALADDGARLEVIDGQHTVIGVLSRRDIPKIPVLVINAGDVTARASAFVGHNTDRVAMTPMQIFFAAVAAGDDDAYEIQAACRRAGARILKSVPADGRYTVGDTIAVGVLRSIFARRGVKALRQVLQIAVSARLAPISADDLRAIDELLFGDGYRGEVTHEQVALAMLKSGSLEREIRSEREKAKVSRWKAMAHVAFRAIGRRT